MADKDFQSTKEIEKKAKAEKIKKRLIDMGTPVSIINNARVIQIISSEIYSDGDLLCIYYSHSEGKLYFKKHEFFVNDENIVHKAYYEQRSTSLIDGTTDKRTNIITYTINKYGAIIAIEYEDDYLKTIDRSGNKERFHKYGDSYKLQKGIWKRDSGWIFNHEEVDCLSIGNLDFTCSGIKRDKANSLISLIDIGDAIGLINSYGGWRYDSYIKPVLDEVLRTFNINAKELRKMWEIYGPTETPNIEGYIEQRKMQMLDVLVRINRSNPSLLQVDQCSEESRALIMEHQERNRILARIKRKIGLLKMLRHKIANMLGISEKTTGSRQIQSLGENTNFHQEQQINQIAEMEEPKTGESELMINTELKEYLNRIDAGNFTKDDVLGFIARYKRGKGQDIAYRDRVERIKGILVEYFNCTEEEIYIGDIDFKDIDFETVPYKVIFGNATFTDSLVRRLDTVFIGGNVDFRNSYVSIFKKLIGIGGNVYAYNSNVKSFQSVKRIGGDANLQLSAVEDLGDLMSIGGNADFLGSQVRGISQLQDIEGEVYWGDRLDLKQQFEEKTRKLNQNKHEDQEITI